VGDVAYYIFRGAAPVFTRNTYCKRHREAGPPGYDLPGESGAGGVARHHFMEGSNKVRLIFGLAFELPILLLLSSVQGTDHGGYHCRMVHLRIMGADPFDLHRPHANVNRLATRSESSAHTVRLSCQNQAQYEGSVAISKTPRTSKTDSPHFFSLILPRAYGGVIVLS
jgi:hypothetical protein